MTFGAQADESESNLILDYALAAGINFVDTANIYAKGASEEILGRLLRGRRHEIVVASKVRGAMSSSTLDRGLSRPAMEKALENTLRRLQTDYLDIYYLHQPDYDVPFEETLDTLDKMIRQGRVRFAATSNFASWQVCQTLWIAEKKGYQPPRITQPMYNLLARGVEQEYVPMAREFGVSIIAYNPLAGGLLTGKHSPARPAEGSRFVDNEVYRDRYWRPQYLEAVDRLKSIASQAGRTLISLSLGWLLHHTATTCVVLGASRLEQLKINLRAIEEGPLAPGTIQQCDEVWMWLKGCTPQYNR
jgi:aryl-alcohol dehydrogenase-like predicted oxidoreductase